MTATAPSPIRPRRTLSLERKLPLLMTAVLVVALASSLALTYRTLARVARENARERLAQVARQLAASAETATRQRTTLIQGVASDSAVRRALRVTRGPAAARLPAADSIALSDVMRRLQAPSDSGLPSSLWTDDGRRVATVGTPLGVVERPEGGSVPPPAMLRNATDSVRTGPMYESGGRVFYQVLVPVDVAGERLGYLVMLRRVNSNPRLATTLRELSGEDVALYAHQPHSPLWASLTTGRPMSPPSPDSGEQVVRAGVGPMLATHTPLPGSPWVLTLEEPLASVLRGPKRVLLSLAALSAVLTVVGAVASWLISRRITRPLASLTAAAEAIARGDYKSRVDEDRGDEVGRLARSFNQMAWEVDGAQQQLASQITEARSVAAELERANRQLHGAMSDVESARDAAEQANRAKSDFLAVMSHELRTPLNAIGGYAELMQLGIYGVVTDEQIQTLSRITRSQQHLLGLINDVLNFAKLSAAKVQYDIRNVALNDAIATVETMIGPQLDAKALRYDHTSCDPALFARADREKLQQILLNLLSNAVKFTARGGRVSVGCTPAGDLVEVWVRDTGVGIPADRLRLIFEPFVQVDRALNRPHEGVGLGLAISHDLARGMNGELHAESTIGEGSVFTLRLPRGDRVSQAIGDVGARGRGAEDLTA